MGDRPRLLVVVPAYNEEESLPSVLDDLRSVIDLGDVLVVDDGSRDATSAVALSAGARVARLSINLGIGGALRTGFRYAWEHGYDRAVQFDGDGQHIADQIAVITDALDAGANVAIGSRFASVGGTYEVSMARGGAMRLLRSVVRILSGHSFSDTSSGFRALDRRAIGLFSRRYPAEYMDSVESLLLALNEGLRVVEVPVHMRGRVGGQPSTRSLRLVWHFLRVLTVVVVNASREPRRTLRSSET